MAYTPNGYYSPSALPGQSLGKRSSPDSSTASSPPSCSAPYGSISMHHPDTPRTLSPPSGLGLSSSTAGTAVMYSRTQYHSFAHDQLQPPHTQPTSFGPQYLQAQVAHSIPVYQPEPAPRHMLRPAPFDGYALGPLAHHHQHQPQHHTQQHQHQQHPLQHHHHQPQQQPSPPMSYYEYAPVYPSYTSSHYHHALPQPPPPPPPTPPHPSPPVDSRQTALTSPAQPQASWLLDQLARLPEEVVDEIRKLVGWDDCWKASQISSWFLRNLHPDKLPLEMQLAGLLHAEQNFGRYGSDDAGASSLSKKSASKGPGWLACYHCFRRKGFEHFELFRWGNTSGQEEQEGGGGSPPSYTEPTPRASAADRSRRGSGYPASPSPTPGRSPPAANSNPHYDPTLTRSSLMASEAAARSAARGGGASIEQGGGGDPASYTSPRIKQTWGVRRFCIDCGLDRGYYHPGDVIDLQQPLKRRDAIWVCRCRKLRQRLTQFECKECGMHCPLSNPSRGGR